jgi:sugar phosphate isomerase/epimerase
MRLGGPVFVESDDPEVLARAHRDLGYRAAYAPGGLTAGDAARIKAVREAFAKHDVVIAETGVWNNLMDPDEETRRKNLTAVIEGLALADELGSRCCVNIGGGFNPDFWAGPHRHNFSQAAFDLAVENARKIIDAVKPKTAKFTYEMMPHMIPDSADRYLALIEAIDRPAFGVHLDAVNVVNSPYRYYDVSATIQECFDKLGPYVASCHLKDIRMEDDITVRLGEVLAGRGGFDIALYLKGIAALPQQPPAMLEHLASAEDYDQARTYVLSIGQRAGISFQD